MTISKSENEILTQAISILEREFPYKSPKLNGTELAKDYFRLKFGASRNEQVYVAFLNTSLDLIECKLVAQGTIDKVSVHVREIMRVCLILDASAIMLAHNHPSKYAIPSNADKKITKAIFNVCSILDIRLLDHFIVSTQEAYSFAENGLL